MNTCNVFAYNLISFNHLQTKIPSQYLFDLIGTVRCINFLKIGKNLTWKRLYEDQCLKYIDFFFKFEFLCYVFTSSIATCKLLIHSIHNLCIKIVRFNLNFPTENSDILSDFEWEVKIFTEIEQYD